MRKIRGGDRSEGKKVFCAKACCSLSCYGLHLRLSTEPYVNHPTFNNSVTTRGDFQFVTLFVSAMADSCQEAIRPVQLTFPGPLCGAHSRYAQAHFVVQSLGAG